MRMKNGEGGTCAMIRVWTSEDISPQSVLLFHHVGPNYWTPLARFGDTDLHPLSCIASMYLPFLFVCLFVFCFLAALVCGCRGVGIRKWPADCFFIRIPGSGNVGFFFFFHFIAANSPLAGNQRSSQRPAVFLALLLCLWQLWNTTTKSCDFQSILFWKTGSPTSPTWGKTVSCCWPK